MLTISLVRHGKTSGNLRGEYIGGRDLSLAAVGRRELESLPGTLPAVQAVYVSPMKRCTETAAILYPDHAPVIVADLRERTFGEFEGKTHDEIIRIPGYEDWGMTAACMDFPGGEEKAAFFRRVAAALRETASRCAEEGHTAVAFVTHGGVIMALMEQLCPPHRDYYDWFCPNGGGYLVTWDGDRLTLLRSLAP